MEKLVLEDAGEGVVWADRLLPEVKAVLKPSTPAAEPRANEARASEPNLELGPAHPKVSATFEQLEEQLFTSSVSAVDMPAIDVDTGIVVVPQLQILQLTTVMGWWEVSWLDPAGYAESLPIVDSSPREVERRVREVNEKLRASQWRSMERLAIELHEDIVTMVDPDEPPGQRRVQAIVQHGELIVRIPGVRVLERHPIEKTSGSLSLYRIYADRPTGTVLVIFMACTGEDCTCDPAFTAQVMRFDPATFTWIDRRPCIHCEPLDLGFTDGNPWD